MQTFDIDYHPGRYQAHTVESATRSNISETRRPGNKRTACYRTSERVSGVSPPSLTAYNKKRPLMSGWSTIFNLIRPMV